MAEVGTDRVDKVTTITAKAEREAATDEATAAIVAELAGEFDGREKRDQGRGSVADQAAGPTAHRHDRDSHRRPRPGRYPTQPRIAESGSGGPDQLDGQHRVGIGKIGIRPLSRAPQLGRPSPRPRLLREGNQARRFQRVKVLAHRHRRDAQSAREGVGVLRSMALQPVEDFLPRRR